MDRSFRRVSRVGSWSLPSSPLGVGFEIVPAPIVVTSLPDQAAYPDAVPAELYLIARIFPPA